MKRMKPKCHTAQVVKGTANPDGPFSRGAQKGAAYVYRRSATTGLWYEESKLFLDDGLGTDRYGWQVCCLHSSTNGYYIRSTVCLAWTLTN